MSTMGMLWIVWAGITAVALGLTLYRAMLTRYEEDQLFLNPNIMSHEQERQVKLQSRIQHMQPYLRAAGGAACLLLVGLVGTYTWQAWLAIR